MQLQAIQHACAVLWFVGLVFEVSTRSCTAGVGQPWRCAALQLGHLQALACLCRPRCVVRWHTQALLAC